MMFHVKHFERGRERRIMLREYISRKIRENEELIIDLESDIKNGKNRKKELEKLIEILEDENNDGSEIFSPRNHREQNLDKLKHYQEDLKKISEEIEDKLNKLSEIKKKKSEYKSMLAEAEKNQRKDSEIEYTGQSETEQTEQAAENQNENHEEGGKERTANEQAEDQTEQKEGGQSNGEIKQQSDKNLIQTKEKDSEYEEQETAPDAMDTKIIIQKSIEDIVKRIESGEGQNLKKSEQKHETKQKNKNNDVFEKIQAENRMSRNLDGIEIKSGELIVLESERKKEKEFLEKIKKNLDLCFIYSGNRSKCRNELIKVKKMIESYISSIE